MSIADDLDALDLVLTTDCAFAPTARLRASEWAEANLYLPAESNARPGPLRLARYQSTMIDALDDPEVNVGVLKCAGQIGKSLAIDALVTSRMAQEPGPFLAVYPIDDKGKAWVQDRLNPLIDASPILRALIGGGGKGKAGHSYRRKKFPGGSLNIGSSHKAEDLAQRSIALLLLDEVDRFAASVGQEGDPVELALKRIETFEDRAKAILASTPTYSGSRIHRWFLRGDQREWWVPCPECGTCAPLGFSRLKWTPNKPQTAILLCEAKKCGHHMSERERMAAVEQGDWVAQAEGEAGIISFHATSLISSFTKMEKVAAKAEQGAQSEANRRVFLNMWLAEPYKVEGVALETDEIADKAVPLVAPYPAEIQFVAAAVDVQQNRVEVTFLGTAKAGVQYVLDHVVVEGDTSGHAVWEGLDATLGRTFPLADRGRVLAVVATAIDAGYQQQAVVEFVMSRRRRGFATFPVLGRQGFERPVTAKGSKLRDIVRSTIIGTDQIKLDVHHRLAMPKPEGKPGPGALVLPAHLPAEYFEQLAFERLETAFVRGAERKKWVPKAAKASGGGQNEALDCLVYAVAISRPPFVRLHDPAVPRPMTPAEEGERARKLTQQWSGS